MDFLVSIEILLARLYINSYFNFWLDLNSGDYFISELAGFNFWSSFDHKDDDLYSDYTLKDKDSESINISARIKIQDQFPYLTNFSIKTAKPYEQYLEVY